MERKLCVCGRHKLCDVCAIVIAPVGHTRNTRVRCYLFDSFNSFLGNFFSFFLSLSIFRSRCFSSLSTMVDFNRWNCRKTFKWKCNRLKSPLCVCGILTASKIGLYLHKMYLNGAFSLLVASLTLRQKGDCTKKNKTRGWLHSFSQWDFANMVNVSFILISLNK